MEGIKLKIWKLECSHSGDPLYTWAYFKNKPSIQTLINEFNLTKELPKEKDLAQLINTGRVKIKWDEFYLEEVEVIENDMGF